MGGGYSIFARQLYADLLATEVFNYLSQNKVDYYFVNIIGLGPIKDVLNRKWTKPPYLGNFYSILSKYEDHLIFKDFSNGDIANIVGGHRVTTNLPQTYHNGVYFYGPCTATGAHAIDDKTIESFLQRILNENNLAYRVVNCGTPGSGYALNNDLNELYALMDTKFNEGDIVVFLGQTLWNSFVKLPKEKYMAFSEIFSTPPFDKVKCFEIDSNNIPHPDHIDEKGYEVVAKVIFERIKPNLKSNKIVEPFFSRIKREIKLDINLEDYLSILSKERVNADKIGAIVMNCNPFTKGHMYLIENALKKVDFLYIFVVEEDLSEFSFKDRFAIVQKNCKKFNNVKVLPSGKYMISTFTFAEYFKKDDLQEKNIMPAKDVRLFGSAIAKCLNIKFRFVGEEPLDNVTRQYNETMKQILGDYGIKLIEIPRCKLPSGEIINATKVRKLLKEGKFQECRQYLTEETYSYIIDSIR